MNGTRDGIPHSIHSLPIEFGFGFGFGFGAAGVGLLVGLELTPSF